MENCLVTTLKEKVNNSNLPVFGKFMLDLRDLDSSVSSTFNVVIGPLNNGLVTIKDNEGNTIAQSDSWINTNMPVGKMYHIYGGENVDTFNIFGNQTIGLEARINSYGYLTKVREIKTINDYINSVTDLTTSNRLQTFYIQTKEIKIPKSDMISWINERPITEISIICSKKYFTMDDFGRLENVTTLNSGENGGGRVEDYVARKRQLGHSTGSVTWKYITPGSTFNGNVITNRTSNVLSWTATTITFGGVEIQNSEVAPA